MCKFGLADEPLSPYNFIALMYTGSVTFQDSLNSISHRRCEIACQADRLLKEAEGCFAFETHRLHGLVRLNKLVMVHDNRDKLSYWGQYQACNEYICVPGSDHNGYRIVAPPGLLSCKLDMRLCVPWSYQFSAYVQQITRLPFDANLYRLPPCLT